MCGDRLVIGNVHGQIVTQDQSHLENPLLFHTTHGRDFSMPFLRSMAARTNGEEVVTLQGQGMLALWKLRPQGEQELKVGSATVVHYDSQIAVSPDGGLLAVVETVRLLVQASRVQPDRSNEYRLQPPWSRHSIRAARY